MGEREWMTEETRNKETRNRIQAQFNFILSAIFFEIQHKEHALNEKRVSCLLENTYRYVLYIVSMKDQEFETIFEMSFQSVLWCTNSKKLRLSDAKLVIEDNVRVSKLKLLWRKQSQLMIEI